MKKHHTKLIDGTFSADRARSILMGLINHKINFHGKTGFSNEIRYGSDHEHSDKRILELTREKEDLTQWLNSLKDTDTIEISCNIILHKTS